MVPARKLEYSSAQPHVNYKKSPKSIKRAKRKQCPETVLICLVAFLFAGICILYLGQQVSLMRLSVQLSELEAEYRTVQQENEMLQLRLSQARSLSNIEAIARNQLGMVEPNQSNMLVVAPRDRIEPVRGDWQEESGSQGGMFQMVADIINRWLPLGGVEAGRIGR